MAAGFLALISLVVMQLWNNFLPETLHVGTITFWQAAGIFILCKILFGFGRMGRFGGPGRFSKNRLTEKVQQMSPEKRARFEERFGEHMFDCRKAFRGEKNQENQENI
jgi:hypothetical protein